MCDYPEADCISIALTSLLAQLLFFLLYIFFPAWKPPCFITASRCMLLIQFFIVIIPPCLINSIIIKFLCVFDCMVHRWLIVCCVCFVCVCATTLRCYPNHLSRVRTRLTIWNIQGWRRQETIRYCCFRWIYDLWFLVGEGLGTKSWCLTEFCLQEKVVKSL